MVYAFELGHNFSEASKKVKSEDTGDNTWFKKFRSVWKNLNDQPRLGRPETVDSDAVIQAIETNQESCTQRVSDELSISLFSVVYHLYDFDQSIQSCSSYLTLPKYCKTFNSPK